MQSDEDFYKKEFFDQITKRFDSLDTKIQSLNDCVDKLNNKITYARGWAAGFGLVGGLIITFLLKIIWPNRL